MALLAEGGHGRRLRLKTWRSWRRAVTPLGCVYKHGPPWRSAVTSVGCVYKHAPPSHGPPSQLQKLVTQRNNSPPHVLLPTEPDIGHETCLMPQTSRRPV